MFGHKAGAVLARHDWLPEVELLILESPRSGCSPATITAGIAALRCSSAPLLARAWHHMELAARNADARELGQGGLLTQKG